MSLVPFRQPTSGAVPEMADDPCYSGEGGCSRNRGDLSLSEGQWGLANSRAAGFLQTSAGWAHMKEEEAACFTMKPSGSAAVRTGGCPSAFAKGAPSGLDFRHGGPWRRRVLIVWKNPAAVSRADPKRERGQRPAWSDPRRATGLFRALRRTQAGLNGKLMELLPLIAVNVDRVPRGSIAQVGQK